MQVHPSLLVLGDLLELTGLLGLPAQPGLLKRGFLCLLLACAQCPSQTALLQLQPRRLGDEIALPADDEYVPDGMDGLGMPGQRGIPGAR